ncbi:MAG TPA: TonB family protein, partial [Thermoanaerobaculia bacterium]
PPAPAAQKEPEPAKAPEKPPEPAKTEPEGPRTKVGELVEAGPGVSPPQLVSVPKPGYPPMARTLRVEGTVVVSVLVDENGQVQDVRMAEPIRQNVGLNEAGLAAARSAHYKPATKDGVRVKMWTRLRIPFKL